MRDLNSLRAELREIDDQLLALIARRQALSLDIGQRKVDAGLGTRDFVQEKRVVDRAKRCALQYGLNEELAEKVVLLLIEASLTAQERDRVVRRGEGHGQSALVIGGAGKMGGWVARFLASQGFDVSIADPRESDAGFRNVGPWQQAKCDHDVTVVAAPLRTTRKILEEMVAAPPRGLLFDVGSLKTPLRAALISLARAGTLVTSIHPMFGPDTDLLSGRHVIFVDVGVPEATRQARQLFDSTMVVPVEMDLDSHDRIIAYVLGLSHALNIAFFTALAESGESVPELAEFSSTTFDSQLDVATRVSTENPHLYFEIQTMNSYGTQPLRSLGHAVDNLARIVEQSDEKAFVDIMNRGRSYLSRMQRP